MNVTAEAIACFMLLTVDRRADRAAGRLVVRQPPSGLESVSVARLRSIPSLHANRADYTRMICFRAISSRGETARRGVELPPARRGVSWRSRTLTDFPRRPLLHSNPTMHCLSTGSSTVTNANARGRGEGR